MADRRVGGRRASDRQEYVVDHPDHVRDMEVSITECGELEGMRVERHLKQRFITFRVYHIAIIALMIAAAMIGGAFAVGYAIGSSV